MRVNAGYWHWVSGQLAAAGTITSRRMFGAVAPYLDGLIVGIISGDTLYFKANDRNRAHYLALGMKPFRPYANQPQVRMNDYQVPADVLEDPEQCALWALRAIGSTRSARGA